MKMSKRIRYLFFTLSAVILCLSLNSCKKDDDSPAGAGGYPKVVSIEYKAIASAGVNSGTVLYINETAAYTTLIDRSFPFTTKFNRTINKKGDLAQLGFTASGSGSVTLQIFVNDVLVKTATPTGSGALTGSVEYLFP